ncbi:chalcone isomerase family protein [Roseibium sediminis]|uniref:chalcone isomerase family protein n=1 Tax=Roseibium sediminis TaxID=1775174 RepID=UPI001AD94430|nr:chalcone isomerase family protein [Roseibium sediminis]
MKRVWKAGPFALAVMVFAACLPGFAAADAALQTVPNARLVGEGQMRFLGFRIFNAQLFAPEGTYDPRQPFALRLTYLRDFKGTAISSQTIEELQRLGVTDKARLTDWKNQMDTIFPNVKSGQTITGVRTKGGQTEFHFQGRKIGTISDRDFTRVFFDIWLGTRTKNPSLRARLVGQQT